MSQEIKTICGALPLKLGQVNCYWVKTASGFILVDTGSSNQRAMIEKELLSAGCKPGDLTLILITHGDFDHTGNAAYLRQKFGAKIAMHRDDAAMLERGDMFSSRKKGNPVLRWMAPRMFGFGSAEQCAPDMLIEDGMSLAEYGWDAKIVSIPGHSGGSIGILTAEGDLLCGDLFENVKQPAFNSIMDDLEIARISFQRLKKLGVRTVYPGHGQPFLLEALA
ncbi:MAG TPA: MBL fold metallo-hydrolase [Anaerolineaceae bacterium]|nr:MBL fold metallo-hydrolase [Anaerolineaceae bacterium]